MVAGVELLGVAAQACPNWPTSRASWPTNNRQHRSMPVSKSWRIAAIGEMAMTATKSRPMPNLSAMNRRSMSMTATFPLPFGLRCTTAFGQCACLAGCIAIIEGCR